MGHKQTAGEYITHEVALDLIRRRLDAGQPVGANDLRALGVSLATDRYKLALRIALAERGLRRRPRVRSAAEANTIVPSVPRAPSVDVDMQSVPTNTPTPQKPSVVVYERAAHVDGAPAKVGLGSQADQRIVRGLLDRLLSRVAARLYGLQATVRAVMSAGSASPRR